MRDLLPYLPYLISLVCAILGYMGMRQGRENKWLRKKLAVALSDCLAFYKIEEALCQFVFNKKLPVNRKYTFAVCTDTSPLGIKRFFRALLRAEGTPTPSDQATPHQIEQELRKL